MNYKFRGKRPQLGHHSFVAPSAILVGDVRLGDEASIWFNSVVRADINFIDIGAQTNIQDGCVLHVTGNLPLKIGRRVTVGHNAVLHAATIGSDCLIAMGAIILDGAIIEDECIVAAGALIAPGSKIPKGSLVMGSPGRVVRHLTELDYSRIKHGWQNYVGYSAEYLAELQEVP